MKRFLTIILLSQLLFIRVAAQEVAYLRSNTGEPWGQNENVNAMNDVFGSGNWTSAYFQTVNANTLFSSSHKFVFIEGSDGFSGTNAMYTFLEANSNLIEDWVAQGNTLYLNSASNIRGGSVGFGVTFHNWIQYGVEVTSATVTVYNPSHPLFTQSFQPTSVSYTGGWFAHDLISGNDLNTIITGDGNNVGVPDVVLAEKDWGSGKVMFGGITTPNFHQPILEARNLRRNILEYLYNEAEVDVTPPVLSGVPASVTVECDAVPVPATVTATDNVDENVDVVYSEVKANGNCLYNYTLTRTWSATDVAGNDISASQTITVSDNTAPVLQGVPPSITTSVDANKCDAVVNYPVITATDNCGTATITYSHTSGSTFPLGATLVTVTATDECNNSIAGTFTVIVTNAAPVLSNIVPGTISPVSINTPFSASAPFTDNNLQSATWSWDDGTTSAGTIGAATVTGSRTYTAAGVYTIGLAVTDACNSTALTNYQYVVVYDPSGGFVTGGGWINSPAGAYKANLTMAGKANFGFVSKYLKGATKPSGETNFEFQTANLHFQSTSYEWLVVSGYKAQYKGAGTINGSGNYGFILSAIDGQVTGGGGTDKFRIKIWDKNNNGAIVYDNNLGDGADDALAETILGGGSIVVHEAKRASTSKTIIAATEPQKSSFYSYPTAFSNRTTIAFSLEQNENYVLEVFDMKGALVRKLAAGTAEANKLYEVELNGNGMMEGVYITRLTTSSNIRSLKTVLKR